ncbi:hypothetical protein [uncultured Mucilaginibacter sp.]|uniref:hypothetical protein n=1 Tax=uncultured Mucilaginibacter sp. TaxID=797541 RepID=UPI0025F7EAB2|nr:hypothetical protein [uncultured Mucilaginibacter sp.]
MMNFRYCLLICFLLSGCSGHAQKLIFTHVPLLTSIDTSSVSGKISISKQECYLIENFTEDSISVKTVDDFVNTHKDSVLKKYANYYITFYKKSSQTNIENIRKNKRIIDRYSFDNDLIYNYFWAQGKFICRFRYKNGELIDPKNNITVKDP